jgi:hypothetical protein
MSPPGGSDLLELARRVLLDALEALEDQHDALVLIGAQAIYLHTGGALVALPEATKDSDLAVDRRRLAEEPLLEQAMARAGFELAKDPGSWRGAMGVPVDLMIPDSMSDPGGRRGGRIPPHSRRATRRASGLEATMVDRASMRIAALEATDDRAFTIAVAGPAALVVAKMHKLGERDERDPARLNDKDAHDVYRLLVGVSTEDLSGALDTLLGNDLAAEATRVALDYFVDLFAAGPEAPGCQMAGRAEQLVGDPANVALSTAELASDLVRAIRRRQRRN